MAKATLEAMRDAGDTADMLADELSDLGEAVACRAPLAIIDLRLGHGAGPNGFSRDAREYLTKLSEGAYRNSVEDRFGTALAVNETIGKEVGPPLEAMQKGSHGDS
ncbi:hypothetical protein [Luteibacter sahnii]|uniref:hypothetical protein n=1 Tax=Luteibacter sahnii TaxID=3021977 RepID=UPI002A6AC35C|nr:hypothetical protein [Luteibacter sp. PPL193]MDY1549582.1 hypothetical protein [Luteibacter sp. PPL193]